MNNWIEVNADRLTANFQTIQTEVGPATTILAVIKANAYGHGAEECASILVRAGATWLGVTSAGEGARIRRVLEGAGLDAELLIMSGFLPADVELIHRARLTPVLWTREQVGWLAAYPGTKVHVEVDTGMGRQGVTVGADTTELLACMERAGLIVDGIFTHFCSSEAAPSVKTAEQQRLFASAMLDGQKKLQALSWIHAANSSAIDSPARPGWLQSLAAELGARMMVRPGLALYGYTLPVEGGGDSHLRPRLQPVMTWKARVLATRMLKAGDTVGYNSTWQAERATRVAVLPVGYADGLRRELSSTNDRLGGWVCLHGQRAPILGRISMNLTVVDVSGVDDVQADDEAILLGDGITAEDHAALAGTIPYEILCGVHPCT